MSNKRFKVDERTLTDWAKKIDQVLDSDRMLDVAKKLYRTMQTKGKVYEQNQCDFDESKYPRLPSDEQFDCAHMAGLIDETGYLKSDALELLTDNPLAQLLYAVIWKNGDLNKFGPIKKGLLDENKDQLKKVENQSYVFYQFGRHLKDNAQPIVDQHTVRAVMLLDKLLKKRCSSDLSVEQIRALKKPNKARYEYMLCWVERNLAGQCIETRVLLDRILFMYGKLAAKTVKV